MCQRSARIWSPHSRSWPPHTVATDLDQVQASRRERGILKSGETLARFSGPISGYRYEVMSTKPEPRAFLATLERLNVPHEPCMFVDDAEQNARGARAVGID